MPLQLISLLGLFFFVFLGWCCSSNRKIVNLRILAGGITLQLLLAMLVFLTPGSKTVFLWLNDRVIEMLESVTAGQQFLFGPLAVPPRQMGPDGTGSLGFILAVQALPIIVVFSALMGALYYLGIMPLLIRGFSRIFTRLMRISGAESLCVASNIFVGIESATAIRPYLEKMTRSELCTILTAGMATVASSTLGIYVLFLKDVFPDIAGHLISASILSAPAAVVMSKVLVPEDSTPVTLGEKVPFDIPRESGLIESIINGAMAGMRLVVGVCALLLAFIGILALLDWVFASGAAVFGWDLAGNQDSIISVILGWLMTPLALLMGITPQDASIAGELFGLRLVATEIPAYQQLAGLMHDGVLQQRSGIIISYGLCGFAHIASLAIFVGGIAALAPSRRADLARVSLRAFMAATLACLMVGAIAGVFC